jgi:hypothetical protein
MAEINAQQKQTIDTAVKYDAFKPPLNLIPKSALDEEAALLGFGAEKYDAHNWRKGMPWSRLISAAMRHLVDFNAGQDFDKESGLHALAHVRACCGFLIEYTTTHPELDDRFKQTATVAPTAIDAELKEWAKNVNERRMLESIALGRSKSPPWHTK